MNFQKKKTSFWLLALVAIAFACTPKSGGKLAEMPVSKPVIDGPIDEGEKPVEWNLGDVNVSPDSAGNPDVPMIYQNSAQRDFDLLHEKVELKFDWPKAQAIGTATLELKPFFYSTEKLVLDAKNFEIKSVHFDGQTAELKNEYDGQKLTISLGRVFSRNEKIRVVIDYVARPNDRDNFGGSAAITSDKGLFFINNDGADKEKPMQIWTQGETENNSRWMPTIDKPNERCTGEVILTVEDKYKTLSNGLLFSSKKNADGSRTDHWKMDKPHAPYLFMIAVGDFAVVRDKWRGMDVNYFVEPKYEKDARAIFPYTTEMLEFFSKRLGVDYAWPSFSQIIVRDYVSGAMENTGAVIFGEYMQQTTRELLDTDGTNEKVVAHEMFHHWFGDLVTCESWSNLTMNEGFANYSEYLWMEQKHGREAADHHFNGEKEGYFASAADGGHDLIHYEFDDKEQMFDAHSYNKGGCVLHMLRQEVGDDAFFESLKYYLTKNQFTDVEADELRLVFEDVTGRDLNWFFNQWYFSKGHPRVTAKWAFDAATKKVKLRLEQTQEVPMRRLFRLPISVEIWQADGSKKRQEIVMENRSQDFEFESAAQPALVECDPERTLLVEWQTDKSDAELAFQYKNSTSFMGRVEPIQRLGESESEAAKAVFETALDDKFWSLREMALSHADFTSTKSVEKVVKLAETDPRPSVRAMALALLGETGDAKYASLFQKAVTPDGPYSVVGAGLAGLAKVDPAAALKAAEPLENDESPSMVQALAEIYGASGEAKKLAFFDRQMGKTDGPATFAIFDNYAILLKKAGDEATKKAFFDKCYAFALDPAQSQWRRFGSTKSLADFRTELAEAGKTAEADALTKQIEEIKTKETDEVLKMYYGMF